MDVNDRAELRVIVKNNSPKQFFVRDMPSNRVFVQIITVCKVSVICRQCFRYFRPTVDRQSVWGSYSSQLTKVLENIQFKSLVKSKDNFNFNFNFTKSFASSLVHLFKRQAG